MALNESQIKEAKILEDHLDAIQDFVNTHIITANNSMTKLNIYAGLGSVVSHIDETKFGRAFSTNVKLGKIKGIYGAGKAGFKSKTHEEKENTAFADVLNSVISFVQKNIIEAKTALTSAVIYEKLSINNMTQQEFSAELSKAVKDGRIKGIVGVRAVGYKPVDMENPSINIERHQNNEDKFQIELSSVLRLCAVDKRNWALQKKVKINNDEHTWISTDYWPCLETALKGIAKRLVNKELKNIKASVKDIRDVALHIKEVEDRIVAKLSGMVQDVEDNDDEEEEVA